MNSHLLKWIVNKEDVIGISKFANKNVLVKCDKCGYEEMYNIKYLSANNKYPCPRCSDSYSYPEKFINEMLQQLNINFTTQLSKRTFEWCNNKRYDFYLPDYNCIIETHGKQHYESCFYRDVNDEQQNDKEKKLMAIKNGIEHYIELDCRKSNLEWIKQSVINSGLLDMFNLKENDINWQVCNNAGMSSVYLEICNYWNNKHEKDTVSTLAKVFELSETSISRALKKGNECGLSSYNQQDELNNSIKRNSKNKSIKIEIFKENNYITTLLSSPSVEKYIDETYSIHIDRRRILEASLTGISIKGFTFKRVVDEETN